MIHRIIYIFFFYNDLKNTEWICSSKIKNTKLYIYYIILGKVLPI